MQCQNFASLRLPSLWMTLENPDDVGIPFSSFWNFMPLEWNWSICGSILRQHLKHSTFFSEIMGRKNPTKNCSQHIRNCGSPWICFILGYNTQMPEGTATQERNSFCIPDMSKFWCEPCVLALKRKLDKRVSQYTMKQVLFQHGLKYHLMRNNPFFLKAV